MMSIAHNGKEATHVSKAHRGRYPAARKALRLP
jgi:hypothetical protein